MEEHERLIKLLAETSPFMAQLVKELEKQKTLLIVHPESERMTQDNYGWYGWFEKGKLERLWIPEKIIKEADSEDKLTLLEFNLAHEIAHAKNASEDGVIFTFSCQILKATHNCFCRELNANYKAYQILKKLKWQEKRSDAKQILMRTFDMLPNQCSKCFVPPTDPNIKTLTLAVQDSSGRVEEKNLKPGCPVIPLILYLTVKIFQEIGATQ